jgi:hypothetical protein
MIDPIPLKKKLTAKQALLTILLSIVIVTGTCYGLLGYYRYIHNEQSHDPAYQIVAVVQTSPDNEGLKTGYLTELLDLSIDRPINLYKYNTQEAIEKLLKLPLIKEASVRKIRPGTIHVDYILRKPIAYIGDYTNTAIDIEGVVFPFKPFYTPKKLPEIYLGEDFSLWGLKLCGERKELAFKLLDLVPQYCDVNLSLCSIDVSNAFASSEGKREIVLVLEDRLIRVVNGKTILRVQPHLVRLRQENMLQQLGNYIVVRKYLRENEKMEPIGEGTIRHAKAITIDLRLSELAFFVF